MATTTPNLELTKPSTTDYVDIQVINDNYDKIDKSLDLVEIVKRLTLDILTSNNRAKYNTYAETNSCDNHIYKYGINNFATLLWTNETPTTGFEATTLEIEDIDDYDYLLMDVKYEFNQDSYRQLFGLATKTKNGLAGCEAITNTTYGSMREFGFSETGVTIKNGYGLGNNDNTNSTTIALPLHIYGIKKTDMFPELL